MNVPLDGMLLSAFVVLANAETRRDCSDTSMSAQRDSGPTKVVWFAVG